MIFMVFPVWLLPLLKSVLPAIGGIGSTIASVNAQEKMNRYNDPRRQLQRLNAAGLPFAAFEAGQAGNQSQLPDFKGIGEAGQALGDFQQNYQQSQEWDIRKGVLEDEAKIKSNERQVSDEETSGLLDYGSTVDGFYGTNAKNSKRLEVAGKEVAVQIQRNEAKIKEAEALVKEATTDEEIALAERKVLQLLQDYSRVAQAMKIEENRNLAKNEIIGRMKKNGLSMVEALFIVLMESISVRGAVGGSHIGN